MARPSREAIDTFMSITGAPESLAVQKLEEHGSDLNEAVNAHYNEGNTSVAVGPREIEGHVGAFFDEMVDIDDPIQDVPGGSMSSLLSESRNVNPISLHDSSLNRTLLDCSCEFTNEAPFATHPGEITQIPVEVNDGSGASANPENAFTIEEVTEAANAHGPDVHGNVIIDDADVAIGSTVHTAQQGSARDNQLIPNPPVYNDLPDYGNDIEEEMVRAAIEASQKEAESGYNEQNHLGNSEPVRSQSHVEDPELAHAISLSIEMALRERGEKVGAPGGRLDVGSSSMQGEAEDLDQRPLIRNRSRSTLSGSLEPHVGVSPPASPTHVDLDNHPHHNRDVFASNEWGGISALEHDEAVMLEVAMFGGIPDGPEHRFPNDS